MTVSIIADKGKFKVVTPGGTKAKGTTKPKANAQAKLLRAVDNGWKPTEYKGGLPTEE